MDDPGSMSAGNIIVKLVILLVLILVNAFFAMSELAIISLNDNKIDKMFIEFIRGCFMAKRKRFLPINL